MEQKIKKFFKIIFFLFFLITLCSNSFSWEEPKVRVAIFKDVPEITISVRGKYKIINPNTNKILLSDRVLPKSKIALSDNGIIIDNKMYPLKHIRLSADKDISIITSNNTNRYRGSIDIIRTSDRISVINIIELEKYIKGVLYHEISNKWPMEAMKAQAVVARTYTLYQISVNKNNYYDVTSDIFSQVYGGRSAERFRTNLAVRRTQGEILTYKGKLIPAYYHSNCGGHTENVSELWKHDYEPLSGNLCPFCKFSPNYTWKKNFQLKDIQERLNKNGYKIGLIKDISIIEFNDSRRIKKLQITARDGKSIFISGKDFRNIIGSNEIKSNKYEIIMQGYYVDFVGKGWGHGVGMCQWGAYEMSKQNYKYSEILQFYYPKSDIKDLRISILK